MKRKPIAGQTLYSLNVGNAARNKDQVLTPVEVTKVGRKFFYTGEGYRQEKYTLDNWQHDAGGYSPQSVLYACEQEWLDDKEKNTLCKAIEGLFNYGRINKPVSLENLRKVAELLDLRIPPTVD